MFREAQKSALGEDPLYIVKQRLISKLAMTRPGGHQRHRGEDDDKQPSAIDASSNFFDT